MMQCIKSTLVPTISTYHCKILRANSGIVHAHHSCGGKRGKLSGTRLSTIFKFASIQVLDTFTSGGYFRIFGQNKVTKMCPKYLLV